MILVIDKGSSYRGGGNVITKLIENRINVKGVFTLFLHLIYTKAIRLPTIIAKKNKAVLEKLFVKFK